MWNPKYGGAGCIYRKKFTCKWTPTVQTCVVHQSTASLGILYFYLHLASPPWGGNKPFWKLVAWTWTCVPTPHTRLWLATFMSHLVLLTLGFRRTLMNCRQVIRCHFVINNHPPLPQREMNGKIPHVFILWKVTVSALFMLASLFFWGHISFFFFPLRFINTMMERNSFPLSLL